MCVATLLIDLFRPYISANLKANTYIQMCIVVVIILYVKANKNLGNSQQYTPITVDQTAPFQTRKILIDLVISL